MSTIRDRSITIRNMPAAELDRIGEIDRSEHVTQEYAYRNGSLERRAVDVQVPRWPRADDHPHGVPSLVNAWRPILDRGGTLLGAFDTDTLVGFAIYQPDLAEAMGNLSALYVSRKYRGKGIGSRLAGEVARLARSGGARRLYVSATPTGPTVDFYRSHGFEPTDEPNEALLSAEPDDIHMILEL